MMRKLLSWFLGVLALLSLAVGLAWAQTTTSPQISAIACAYNTSLPTQTNGQFYLIQCDGGGGMVASARPYGYTPVAGFQQISAATLATAQALTVPTGATIAFISVTSTPGNGASVTYRDDGTAPTASVGQPLGLGQQLTLSGAAELAAVKFIINTGSPTLNISYYK